MPATGIMGYSDAYRRLVPLEILGALVTNPITARPRQGAPHPRVISFPGGMLMHTGLQNPGAAAVIRHHQKRWRRFTVPVIAHVVGVNIEETISCVERISGADGVSGVELGLPDSLTIEEALGIVTAARQTCILPLIVKLPLWRASDLAVHIVERDGADALTIAAPPRGTVWHQDRAVTGRLYGPATFPQALWVLRQVVALTDGAIPLIGCGGIHSIQDAVVMLDAGAVAVQVDSYIWKDPSGFAQLAKTVTDLHKQNGAAYEQPRVDAG